MSIVKNHVDLIGFVGGKPELRRTKTSKVKVTSFGLALNASWTDKNGDRQEADTLWVKIRCWGRQAEVMAEYLDAGSLINVIGKLVQPEAWENRDGDLDAQTVVQARNIIFLDRAPQDEDERPARRRNTRRQSSTRRSSARRTEDRKATTTSRKSSSRKSSIIDDLSEEEVEELLVVLKERDEKPAKKRSSTPKRSSRKPVEVEADEDQPEDISEVEDVEGDEEEEKPARKPRQSATKRVPFARAK